MEHLQLALDFRHIGEERQRLFHYHVEHLGNIFPLVMNIKGLPVVARFLAHFAGNIDIRQKMHLNLDDAVAFAGLAPAALHVEAETAGLVTAHPGFRSLAEQFAHRVEQPGVGGRIRSRRATDRRLVDVDDLVDIFRATDLPMLSRTGTGSVNFLRQRLIQNFVDQGTFAGTGHSGHRREQAQRKLHIDIRQIVL